MVALVKKDGLPKNNITKKYKIEGEMGEVAQVVSRTYLK